MYHEPKQDPPPDKKEEAQEVPSREKPRHKRFGREIAFGIQQTLACWATDFIDPPVSKWVQTKIGNKQHQVTNKHVWGGEVLGDSSALFFYVALKRFFSKPIDAVTSRVKSALDPLYTKLGKKSLHKWQQEKHLDESDPRYRHCR